MDIKYYNGSKHVFYNDNGSGCEILSQTGPLNISSAITFDNVYKYIYSLTDLPTPVASVITLEDNFTYKFFGTIDLLGNRFQCAANNVILGTSSENSNIRSTGLTLGTALFTSSYTLIFQNITIENVPTVFNLSGIGSPVLDWVAFNIENSPNLGLIENYDNFIITNSAFLNCSQLYFDGTIGTIGFLNCLFTNFQTSTSIIIPNTCTITRRLKIVESSFVTSLGGTSIDFESSATVPNQGYVLTAVNFSGGAMPHLVGVQSNDNKALFTRNIGISNSRSIGSIYLTSSITTPLTLNVWTRLLGTTLITPISQKFTNPSDGRILYVGNLTEIFTITYSVSLSGSNNDDIELGVSINGNTPEASSINGQTMSSAGKIDNLALLYFAELSQNDYIEVHVRNTSNNNSVQASVINFAISGIN